MKPNLSAWVVLLVAVMAILGCGKKPEGLYQGLSPEQTEVVNFVRKLNDTANNPEAMKSIFASGSVPSSAQLKEYGKYYYNYEDPTVSGNQATLNMKLKDVSVENGTEKTKMWTVVKEGTGWKLKDAPVN